MASGRDGKRRHGRVSRYRGTATMDDAAKEDGLKLAAGGIKLPEKKAQDSLKESLDESLDEALAGPLSPTALGPAIADLAAHVSPGYAAEMASQALEQATRSLVDGPSPGNASQDQRLKDHRFADPLWSLPPFCFYARNFLVAEQWVDKAIMNAPGVAPHNAKLAAFAARQWLDAFSPSNLPWANPEVLRATAEQGGRNFARGADHFLSDLAHAKDPAGGELDRPYQVGRDVAATPGVVVLRNELMELIQYAPTTPQVRPEPLLIVPAWIMKYYILDLSPHNSFIRYLVGRGFTVFCISWRNPGAELAETSFDDYRRLGPMAALDAIGSICGPRRIHALGYCLGGTLLSVAAATMARDHDERLASLCLLAAQTDFSEPGELSIFIDEPQLDQLDKIMARQGYLDSRQMAGAFSMLRARDLVWSRMVKHYLLGETEHPNDLMAWNADATRMPYRMHSQYLRSLFLRNDLAEGRFEVAGRKIGLGAISTPVFAVGTEEDHVAPWRSVFKIHRLNAGDVTFLLASGGHNGGIVSEPGHKHRSYRIARRPPGEPAPETAEFMEKSARHQGSWWTAYADWLDAHSGPLGPPPPRGTALAEAPGAYVLEH
jgi:polyhydroxyalkanoate synthase